MEAYDVDEAVLAIQQATSDIGAATKKLDDYEGKQDELLAAVKVLTECVVNLEGATHSSRCPKQKERRSVPPYERSLARSIYRDLSHCNESYKLDENFESMENQAIVSKIVTEAKVRQPSVKEEHICWASRRYFLSLYEDHKRSLKGMKDKHRVQQRRLRRKKQKLAHRCKTFQVSPPSKWSSIFRQKSLVMIVPN